MNGRRPLSPFPVAACAALAFVAAACNRDSATTGPSHILGKDFAANLRLVAGDQQVGPLGAPLALPIRVKVVDAGGQPVQGATVAFSVRAGGGSMNPAANVSDEAGIVSSVWTMGTSLGAARVVAILTNAFILDSTTFTATATVGPPRILSKVSGDSQTTAAGTALPAPVVVRVQDAYGNNVSGARVTWTPGVGSGTASAASDTTAANGTASATWTLATIAGANTLAVSTATVAGPVFAATGRAGAPSVITVTAGNNQTATIGTAIPTPPSVSVTDVYGNPVSGAGVVFSVATGGGTLTGAFATTNVSGIATLGSWKLGVVAGAQTLSASIGTLSAVITATAAPGAPAAIAVNSGNNQTGAVGSALAFPPSVIVKDASNNPVPGVSVTFAVTSGGGTVTGGAATTDASGIATVGNWTLGLLLGAQTLSATTGALPVVAFTATGTPGAPASISVNTGNNQSTAIGTAVTIPPSVIVRDVYNNPVSGVLVTFAVATGGGFATGVNTATNASGIATVGSWTLGPLLGAQTLTATSGTLPGSPVMFTATATVVVPAVIAVSVGNNQSAPVGTAVAIAPSVVVKDANGNPMAGVSVTFAVATGGGTVTGANATTNASGIATVGSWTLGLTVGAQTLAATTGALPAVVFTATATPGVPTNIAVNAGNNQAATVGTALAILPSVIVKDANNTPVAGVSMTFTVASGGGSVTGANVTTNAGGIATVGSWTLGTTSGTNRLTATAGSLPGSPVTFTATGTPDATRVVTWTAPATTTVSALTALDTLRVRVTDQYLNPVAGAVVTWNDSIAGNGSVSSTSGTTDTLGNAKTVWTLGRRAGPQILRSKVTGVPQTKTFTATATVAFADVLAGNFMACGIAAATNNVYCWGAGNDGQLGKGGFTNTNVPTAAVPQSGDTASGVALQARQMSGGRNGYCTLSLSRLLFCWGRQMGLAVNAQPAAVTLLAGTAGVTPNVIAIGEDFGCLMNLAGSGFCGGNNLKGQLGNGGGAGTAVGTWVATTAPPTLFSAISTGRAHACGLPRYDSSAPAASQTVYCWGLNNEGQLGDNSTTDRSVPTSVVMGALRFDSTTISTGASHSCALEATGSTNVGYAWCWGGNGFGQLGDASTTRRLVPTAVNGNRTYSKLYAGEYHTCAIEASTGTAYCWGRNDYGQLGNGSRSNSTTPVAVASQTFRSLSVGELHTCGVSGAAVVPGSPSQTAGTIYCWGDNSFGQLGQGTTASNTPVLVPTKVLYQP